MNKTCVLIIGQSIGLRCLKYIYQNKKIKIKCVISSDLKYDKGIKIFCRSKKIKYLDKRKSLSKNLSKKNSFKYDFLLSIFSNLIIKESDLNLFKFGGFNFHPGVLPYYPGLNPISGMIFNSEKKIGVTLHKMTSKVDGGNIIFIKKKSIYSNDNLFSCMRKIEHLTIKILSKFLDNLTKSKIMIGKKNNLNKKKKFPNKIPNNGKFNKKWTYKIFLKYFNAGYAGPYESQWGRIFFTYKGRKKFINNFKLIESRKRKDITKITNKIFDINLLNKNLRVEILNDRPNK